MTKAEQMLGLGRFLALTLVTRFSFAAWLGKTIMDRFDEGINDPRR